jgi:hypothetical protein
MTTMEIERKCGHKETIGIGGAYGDMTGISEERVREMMSEYESETEKSIQWQKDKLCFPCFEALSHEGKQKLLREATRGTPYLEPVLETLKQLNKYNDIMNGDPNG